MAQNDGFISSMLRATDVGADDLFETSVEDSASTGYSSKAVSLSTIASALLGELAYNTDLNTKNKTIFGAINELQKGGGGGGGSSVTIESNPNGGIDLTVNADKVTLAKQSDMPTVRDGQTWFGAEVTKFITLDGEEYEIATGSTFDNLRILSETIHNVDEIGQIGQVWGIDEEGQAGWIDAKGGGDVPENVVTSETMDDNLLWLGTKAEYDALDDETKATKNLFITIDEPYADMNENAAGGVDVTIDNKTATLAKQSDLMLSIPFSGSSGNVSANSGNNFYINYSLPSGYEPIGAVIKSSNGLNIFVYWVMEVSNSQVRVGTFNHRTSEANLTVSGNVIARRIS